MYSKIIRKTLSGLLFVICSLSFSVALTACSDFFDTDLNGVSPVDGRKVQQERDAFYQMNGILQLMQQVGDGYVVTGELRGDLVSQTVNSSQELRDIEFFTADSVNSYLNERKLYAIVNNCNYFIASLDHDYMGLKADTLASQEQGSQTPPLATRLMRRFEKVTSAVILNYTLFREHYEKDLERKETSPSGTDSKSDVPF